MRILVVSQSFYPDNFKINEVVGEFVTAGNKVTVLTGLGDYSTGTIPTRYRWFKNRHENYHGATIRRVRTISRRTGPIFRSLNYLSFAINGWLWGKLQSQKFDVVYVYMPSPVTMGVPAISVAHRQSIPLLIYNLDLWPESVKAMSIKEKTLSFNIIHKISQAIYQQADSIAVSSVPFMDYLVDVNEVPKERLRFIPQYATLPSRAKKETSEERELEKLIKENQAEINLLFAGNIGFVQDVETIIRAVASIQNSINEKQLKIHIVGDGSDLKNVKKLTDSLNVARFVIFYGRRPESTMSLFYKNSDASLLTLKYENKIGETIPAKLQGYLAASQPVLAAIDGDAARIIAESDCGIRVCSGDAVGLGRAMLTFIQLSDNQREQLSQNGYSYFLQNFTKAIFMEKTESWLNEYFRKEN